LFDGDGGDRRVVVAGLEAHRCGGHRAREEQQHGREE
jgi:hypothetical protein